jgi:hypothetical protein
MSLQIQSVLESFDIKVLNQLSRSFLKLEARDVAKLVAVLGSSYLAFKAFKMYKNSLLLYFKIALVSFCLKNEFENKCVSI